MVVENDIKLTNTTNANHPSWSPDGEKIVYAADQAIWIMNSDGSGQKKLYDSTAWEGEPVFNNDGTRIFFSAESKNAFSARYISIHAMDPDGSDRLKLTENSDSKDAAISPDGSILAYTSRASGNYDIWIMSPKGTGSTRITDAMGDEKSPSWSPDGSTLVYSSMGDLFTIGINDVRPVRLTDDAYDNIEPAYSPNGEMIVFASDVGGDYDLWLLDPSGSSHMKINSDLSNERAPAWSPEGTKIAYVSNRDGEYNIWVMTLETAEAELEEIETPVQATNRIDDNEYVLELRDYAANNPKKFIGIVLLVSFCFVALIVGSFIRKIS